jgi:hypothetical protein
LPIFFATSVAPHFGHPPGRVRARTSRVMRQLGHARKLPLPPLRWIFR